jgi:hypothetical protein
MFRNPVAPKAYTAVLKLSSPLPAGYSMKLSLREAGFSIVDVPLKKALNNLLYTGTYNMISSPNMNLTTEILDEFNQVVNSSQYTMGSMAPGLNFVPETGIILTFSNKEEIVFHKSPNFVTFETNTPLELELEGEITYFESPFEIKNITIEKEWDKSGYYGYVENRWLPVEKLTKGDRITGFAKFRDTTSPVIDAKPLFTNDGRIIIEVFDSSHLKNAFIIDGRRKLPVQIEDNKILLNSNFVSNSVVIEAEDYRGNFASSIININKVPGLPAGIKVYPNPATDMVWFESDYAGLWNLRIYDVSGRLIYRANNQSNTAVWDLTDSRGRKVANGTYFYKFMFDNKTETNGKVAVLKQ